MLYVIAGMPVFLFQDIMKFTVTTVVALAH